MNWTRQRALAALAIAAGALSACGGGGGGVSSTPTPTPTPTPSVSYQTIDQLSGNRTYQSAGVNLAVPPDATSKSYKFGVGVTFAYDAAADSYTMTSPDGYNVTMTVSNIIQAQSNTSQTVYSRSNGNVTDNVLLARPAVNGVTLSYLVLANWAHLTNGGGRLDLGVGGVPTLNSDVPKSGSANYSTVVAGSALDLVSNTNYSLNGNSTGTLSINFGAGTVSTSLTLAGLPPGTSVGTPTSLGTFNGTGALDSGGPGFSGTFSGTTVSGFSGALFGPQGVEAAFGWDLRTANLDARGYLVGRKQ